MGEMVWLVWAEEYHGRSKLLGVWPTSAAAQAWARAAAAHNRCSAFFDLVRVEERILGSTKEGATVLTLPVQVDESK